MTFYSLVNNILVYFNPYFNLALANNQNDSDEINKTKEENSPNADLSEFDFSTKADLKNAEKRIIEHINNQLESVVENIKSHLEITIKKEFSRCTNEANANELHGIKNSIKDFVTYTKKNLQPLQNKDKFYSFDNLKEEFPCYNFPIKCEEDFDIFNLDIEYNKKNIKTSIVSCIYVLITKLIIFDIKHCHINIFFFYFRKNT